LAQLDAAAVGATVSPDDAARAVIMSTGAAAQTPGLDAAARAAALRLAAAGEVEIMVGSRVVDPSMARGAIRIRRVRS